MFRFRELSLNFVCAAPKPCSLLKLTFANWFGSIEINDSILPIRLTFVFEMMNNVLNRSEKILK